MKIGLRPMTLKTEGKRKSILNVKFLGSSSVPVMSSRGHPVGGVAAGQQRLYNNYLIIRIFLCGICTLHSIIEALNVSARLKNLNEAKMHKLLNSSFKYPN